jgi:MHS family proline/betaine transporter-like MFS transporter
MSAITAAKSLERRRIMAAAAGAVGNVLEWYDFAAYGFFAVIFGQNFFPSSNHLVSLLSAFAVFAAAFFMRPIGGAIFGHIGDRYGRRTALLISTIVMALSTLLIGCLPTYTTAGALAPVLLVVLRLSQGLSLGGEYASSVTFLAELSRPASRGLLGSLAPLGATLGSLLGSCLGALVAHLLTPADLLAWGWRIPFLLGIGLGALAFWLRRGQLSDEAARPRAGGFPLLQALRIDPLPMLRAFMLGCALLGYFYLVFVYFVTFVQQVDGLTPGDAFVINTLSLTVSILLMPVFGWLSDRWGRRPVIVLALAAMLVFTWPLFRLLSSHHREIKVLLGQLGFAVLLAAYGAPLAAAMAESFSGRTRCSALAVSYNLAAALAGGTAPVIATALVDPQARHPMGPAVYLLALAALSLVAALTLQRTEGKPLRA